MNNKTLVWTLVAVAVLAGAWYYFSKSSGGYVTETPAATTTPAGITETKPATTATKPAAPAVKKPAATTAKFVGTNTIPYLISLKQPLVCGVKTTTGYLRSGTMYVASGKARGNFAGSSMIDDGTHLYVWLTDATKGLKVLASSSSSGSAVATNGGVDLATDLSYACNPWTEDASVFTPPTTVSFSSTL